MPRNTSDSARPRRAGSTSATAMPAAIGVNIAPMPISTRPSSSTSECRRERAQRVAGAKHEHRETQRTPARPIARRDQRDRCEHRRSERIGRHRLPGGGDADVQVGADRREDAADHERAGADDEVAQRKEVEQSGHRRTLAEHEQRCPRGETVARACRVSLELLGSGAMTPLQNEQWTGATPWP